MECSIPAHIQRNIQYIAPSAHIHSIPPCTTRNTTLPSASARMEHTNGYGIQYRMRYSLHSSIHAYSLRSSIRVHDSANPPLQSASTRMESTNEYGMQYSMQYPCNIHRSCTHILSIPPSKSVIPRIHLYSQPAREWNQPTNMECNIQSNIHADIHAISIHCSIHAYSLHSSIQVRNSANPPLQSASARMESTNEYGMQYSMQYPCGYPCNINPLLHARIFSPFLHPSP